MIVTAWSNGSPSETGAGLGIRIAKVDRDQHFDPSWTSRLPNLQDQPNPEGLAMDVAAYHKSIADELKATKDRVQNLIGHNLSIGESRESVLRHVLRRHVPGRFWICTGFIVDDDGSTSQLDILIVDSQKPCLFQDGEFVIVTPDAVQGVIEVKTKVDGPAALQSDLEKLGEIGSKRSGTSQFFVGLFAFEQSCDPESMANALGKSFNTTSQAIDALCLGSRYFARHWSQEEISAHVAPTDVAVPGWRSYELDDLAPSYFIGNVVHAHLPAAELAPHQKMWFSQQGGKESHVRFTIDEGSERAR